MRRTLLAVALLVLVGCTSTGNGRKAAAPPSTTRPPITIGQDPSQPTTSAPPTSDWRVASTQTEVLDGLERNGFDAAGVKERDLEGGRLFGMVASWELRVAGVPAFFHVFDSSESLEGWLETAQGMGGIVVFDAVDAWALSLESDGPTRTRSAKLATRIGRALVTRELWQARTIGGS
jgi:hypothetical protein